MLLGAPDVHFNISYSGDCGIIGISTEHEIGVDIERERPVADVSELTSLCFAEDERVDAEQAFLLAWTRKEACLKALGRGLQIRPDRVRCGCSDAPVTTRLNDAVVHIVSTRIANDLNLACAWRRPTGHRSAGSRLQLVSG